MLFWHKIAVVVVFTKVNRVFSSHRGNPLLRVCRLSNALGRVEIGLIYAQALRYKVIVSVQGGSQFIVSSASERRLVEAW